MKRPKILYVDFGTHEEAQEISMFLSATATLNSEVIVYGVEAHPLYAENVVEKFEAFDNVIILPVAVAAKSEKVELYISESSNGHGNSIFATKNNVDIDQKITVQGIDGGALISTLMLLHAPDIVIVKYNIEGAEYHLLNSIIDNDLQGEIDIFCGAPSDMHKVAVLKSLEKEFLYYINQQGIHRKDFFHSLVWEETEQMIIAMRVAVSKKLNQLENFA